MATKKAAHSAPTTEWNCDPTTETNLADWWAKCSQRETWKAGKIVEMMREKVFF